MFKGHASRFMRSYALNGASLIGSKRSGCSAVGDFFLNHDRIARLSGFVEALRSKKIDKQMPSEYPVAEISIADELIDGSSGCSPLLDFSLNQDRIARLSGYLEALRSKKEYYKAVNHMKDRIAEKMYILRDTKLSTENKVLPEVLPFPAEPCYLDDLIRLNALRNMTANMHAVKSVHSMGSHDNADLILCIMRDLIYKLWGLHYSGMIHGNLKPQNVLVFEGECALTSIIIDGFDSLEWKAPEQIINKTQTKASDMFAFGCILYFCITGGYHPFGGTPDQCIQNIVANKMNISRVEDIPDAYHLISLLLSPKPEWRPKANTVFSHPFFEDLKEKIQLVSDLCEGQRDDIDLLNELESNSPILKNPDWLSRFFAYTSIYIHSNKQPFEDFKDVFGPRGSPTFFPSIYMSIYKVASKHSDYREWFEDMQFDEDQVAVMEELGFNCYSQY